MKGLRPIFVRFPWLALVVVAVGIPLWLAGGLAQGVVWWCQDAADVWRFVRGGER